MEMDFHSYFQLFFAPEKQDMQIEAKKLEALSWKLGMKSKDESRISEKYGTLASHLLEFFRTSIYNHEF